MGLPLSGFYPGDMVPADVRLLTARDLFINQSAFTGEAMPVEKMASELTLRSKHASNPLALSSICLRGTSVMSGAASAIVVCTGTQTFLNIVGSSVRGHRQKTHFERGVNQITWVLIRFMLLMAPVVFFYQWLFQRRLARGVLLCSRRRSRFNPRTPATHCDD